MQSDQKVYRQSKNAIIISYVSYKWIIAAVTCCISLVYDLLMYKNTRLIFGDKFLIFETGALTKKSREIPYEDILNIRAKQSFLGQLFNYGTVTAMMKNGIDTITFKYVHDPETVRRAVQGVFVSSGKFKIS